MIGRRAVIGLSLLCALVFTAFAAQSASAASAVNTTAYTCVKVATGTGDFTDPHCDTKGKGDYAHKEIGLETTATEATNDGTKGVGTTEKTPAVLKGNLGGVNLEITCTTVKDEKAWLRNTDLGSKKHQVSGASTVKFSGCTVQKPANCTVGEIKTEAVFEGVEGLGAGGNEMGLQFKPAVGEIFTTINLEGAKCALTGKPLEVKGTAIGTGAPAPTAEHAGATLIFTNEMTKGVKCGEAGTSGLCIGGKAAEFSSSTTVRMAPGGDPISLTTATK